MTVVPLICYDIGEKMPGADKDDRNRSAAERCRVEAW